AQPAEKATWRVGKAAENLRQPPDKRVPEGILGMTSVAYQGRGSPLHEHANKTVFSRSAASRDFGGRQIRLCRGQGGARVAAHPEPVSVGQARDYPADRRAFVPYARTGTAPHPGPGRPSRPGTLFRGAPCVGRRGLRIVELAVSRSIPRARHSKHE